jgi:hypothetical protein
MKSWIIYVLALFHGGVLASSWWLAAWLGTLWAFPAILTLVTLVGFGVATNLVLDE